MVVIIGVALALRSPLTRAAVREPGLGARSRNRTPPPPQRQPSVATAATAAAAWKGAPTETEIAKEIEIRETPPATEKGNLTKTETSGIGKCRLGMFDVEEL